MDGIFRMDTCVLKDGSGARVDGFIQNLTFYKEISPHFKHIVENLLLDGGLHTRSYYSIIYLINLNTDGRCSKYSTIPVVYNRWLCLSLTDKLGSTLCIQRLSSIQHEI